MKLNKYGHQVLTEQDAVNMLYRNPDVDIKHLQLDDVDKFNSACKYLHLDMQLQPLKELDVTPAEYHNDMKNWWHMPKDYEIDIAKYCLSLCKTEEQLQRVGKELLLYQERELFKLLEFLHYFVKVMREKNIVWGVGRGSSVASYVLYLLGVHKIDSIYYDLDVEEFLR
jgi:DNA polymerase III alpha subunit